MDDAAETVVGIPAYRPSAPPERAFTLEALARGDRRAESAARAEAMEIARALAAQHVALAADAGIDEYDDRRATLERSVWPDVPLHGYRLQSSLGAFLIARLAVSWAQPSSTKLRDAPLDASSLGALLRELGVESRVVSFVLGSWTHVDEDFTPESSGLDAQRLAALAEGAMTARERALALAQAAYSPRCLARLASTAQAVAQARVVLPLLPPSAVDLGAGYAPAVAALALGRPDRTLDLLGYDPQLETLRTLVELAHAQWTLGRGEPVNLRDGEHLELPAFEALLPGESEARHTLPATGEGGDVDEDDVLSIVEERVHSTSVAPESPLEAPGRVPRLVRWSSASAAFDDASLAEWQRSRRAWASLSARSGRLLGLAATHPPASVPRLPLPPDPSALRTQLERAGLGGAGEDLVQTLAAKRGLIDVASPEPLFSTARAALRVIVAAAEGAAPSAQAIEGAGDLDWLVRRCRVLALGVRGELDRARGEAGAVSTPESRWVEARMMRFMLRAPETAPPVEARGMAAALVYDLSIALARSVAGTL